MNIKILEVRQTTIIEKALSGADNWFVKVIDEDSGITKELTIYMTGSKNDDAVLTCVKRKYTTGNQFRNFSGTDYSDLKGRIAE